MVTDNTSYWRMDPGDTGRPQRGPTRRRSPMGYKGRGIIAPANCSTIQMVVALKPIRSGRHQARGRVDLSGRPRAPAREAMDELLNQTKELLRQRHARAGEVHKEYALQRHSHIDVFALGSGSTKKSGRWWPETKKILDLKIQMHATACARADLHQPCRSAESRARSRSKGRGAAPAGGRARRAGRRSA